MAGTVYVTLDSSIVPMTDDDGEGNPLTDEEAIQQAREHLMEWLRLDQAGRPDYQLEWFVEREET